MTEHEWLCVCALCLADDVRYGEKAQTGHAAGKIAERLGVVSRELAATRKAKAENDERFMVERDEARAERDALKLAWANFGGRIDHDSRCRTVTVAMPYPPPTAEGCDCGLRDLSLAMEAK
jgi:hypothetical protein